MEPTPDFRWQAFFRRSRDPLFLLNPQRRILYVNPAWEQIPGLTRDTAWGRACTRRKPAVPLDTDAVTRLLWPPPEVLQGRSTQVRRLHTPSKMSWDITFVPFQAEGRLLGILGRIEAMPAVSSGQEPLPEGLQALRYARAQRFRLETVQSKVPAVQRAVEQARVAASVAAAVLIVGETGAGKQWLARAIHQLGPRREEPFAVIDCARLPDADLDTVLFGE